MTVIVKPAERAQAIGAGASMSPGSQILALTANKASANNITIKAGNSVERKKATGHGLVRAFCSSGGGNSGSTQHEQAKHQ